MKKTLLTSTGEQGFIASTGDLFVNPAGFVNPPKKRFAPFCLSLTKTLISLILTVGGWLWSSAAIGQWTQTQPQGENVGLFETDYLRVTCTGGGGSVAGTNNYQGYVSEGNDLTDSYTNTQRISTAFSTVPLTNQFKAKAGKPLTVTIEFDLRNSVQSNFAFMEGYNNSYKSLSVGVGRLGQTGNYETIATIPGDYTDNADRRRFTYTGTFTLPVGTTRAWIAIAYKVYRGCCRYPATIVLPFVVEGASVTMTDSLGTLREPAIPDMILHAPPGDRSYATFQTLRDVCRTFSESVTNTQTQSGSMSVTLGSKVSGGLPFLTIDVENTITASASGSTGQTKTKTTATEKCISITSAYSTSTSQDGGAAAKADNRSLFIGTSTLMAYGIYPYLKIDNTTNPPTLKQETGLVFAPVEDSTEAFFWTKQNIIEDTVKRYVIYTNPGLPAKIRQEARNQNKIWKQVLVQDSLNTINPNNLELQGSPLSFVGGGGGTSYSETVSTSTTTALEVTRFIDFSASVNFTNMVGGVGVEGGYNFTTTKNFGSSLTTSTNNSTTIGYHLEDNDTGDSFSIKIVRDPTYGTPIFILNTNTSKSSCPYEGGYQRDRPNLDIAGTSSDTTTITNVTLGNTATFNLKLCNTSNEARNYNLRFVPATNSTDAIVTVAGSSGAEAGEYSVPANGCRVENFAVNVQRRSPNSPVIIPKLEFQLYKACDPDIYSSVFANVNFAGLPAPTNIQANKSVICAGTGVTFSANCLSGTPTWYNLSSGGLILGTGNTLTQTPSVNTTYYVGCENSNYALERLSTPLVLVATPSPTLNLTSNYTNGATAQIANTTITANNQISAPAKAVYRAGNSITLTNGFMATNGAVFRAEIGGCN